MKFNRTTAKKKSVYSPAWPRFKHNLFLNFLWMVRALNSACNTGCKGSGFPALTVFLQLWFMDQVRFTYHPELSYPAINKKFLEEAVHLGSSSSCLVLPEHRAGPAQGGKVRFMDL